MPADDAVTIRIQEYDERDWADLWPVLRETFEKGDTYAFAPDLSESEARRVWIEAPAATFVARDPAGTLLGTYYIKPNQPELGAHVCNCGYVTAREARGRGVASRLCEHSQSVAVEMGFRAMQFNLVVATNEGAVRLWRKLGFAIVGRLPGAFRHSELGYVDALVMYKTLG